MKKMTKILSLALALALVLGMTAFAGTPSKLVFKDDFSDAADLSFDTFGASRTQITSFDTGASPKFSTNIDTSGEPLTYKKYYARGTGDAALTSVNGQVRFGDATRVTSRTNRNQLVYSVPAGFTFEKSQTEKVALVADIGFQPKDWAGSGAVGSYGGSANMVMTFYKTLADEDPDTTGTQNTTGALVEGSLNRVGNYAPDATAGLAILRGTYGAGTAAWGQDHRFTVVFRPFSMYGHANLDKCASAGTKFTGLNQIAMLNRGIDYISEFASALNGNSNVQEIQAVAFSTISKAKVDYFDFRMMEISLDEADFVIDEERTVTTDKDINQPLRIYFTAPLAERYRAASTVGTADTNFVDKVVVKDAEGNAIDAEKVSATIGMEEVDMGEYTAVLGYVDVAVEDMEYGSNYTVTVPRMENLALIPMAQTANRSVTFTTQAAPSFALTLTASEGLAAGGNAVAADAMAGKTVFFKADAENTTGRAVNGVIVIGIYDAEGNLVKYAAASDKDFATAGTNSFSAAFKVAEGQTAKAFVKGTASEISFR